MPVIDVKRGLFLLRAMMLRSIRLLRRLLVLSEGRPMAAFILVFFLILQLLSDVSWERTQEPTWLHRALAMLTGPTVDGREAVFDTYQKLYPRPQLSHSVTVVEIDEESLGKLGQFPWPRNRLAALIDAIAAHQPLAIGIDIFMPEEDQTSPNKVADNLPSGQEGLANALRRLPTHEAILADSLRAAPTVLAALGMNFPTYATSAGLRTRPVLVKEDGARDPLLFVDNYPLVLASLPELQAAAAGQGMINLSADVSFDGGLTRRTPLVAAVHDVIVPSLSMEMLRVALGAEQIQVVMGGQGIRAVEVGTDTIPTQSNGEIWLRYARVADTLFRSVSAAKVLTSDVDPSWFHNKFVLIGLTGIGLQDQKKTPLGERVAGVETHAQTIEAIVDGQVLLRPWWMKWLEVVLVAIAGGALIYWVPRQTGQVRMRRLPFREAVLTAGISALFAVIGFCSFYWGMVLFDPTLAFVAISSVMGSLISSAWVQRNEEKSDESALALTGNR